jgi:hypothetical protein
MILSQEYIREAFEYSDGNLIWKRRPFKHFKTLVAQSSWNKKYPNGIAGTVHYSRDREYISVGLGNKIFPISRLIWLWHNGVYVEDNIFHKDRNSLNNKIENLHIRPYYIKRSGGMFYVHNNEVGSQSEAFNTLEEAVAYEEGSRISCFGDTFQVCTE